MMSDETIKKILRQYSKYLQDNDFDSFFRMVPDGYKSAVLQFIRKNTDINPLKNMTTIYENMFDGYVDEKDVVIPGNIKKIMPGAFASDSIENIVIEDGELKTIYPRTFLNYHLKEVSIPKNVTTIGKGNFTNSSDVVITTPYRANQNERLRIPQNEVAWYRGHLKLVK